MSRPLAIVVGLLTLWPVAYGALFLAVFFSLAIRLAAGPAPPPDGFERFFSFLLVGHLGTMLVGVALLVFYIVHVFRNPALGEDRRILWTIIIFMGNVVAMPIYWFLYIWRQPGRAAQP